MQKVTMAEVDDAYLSGTHDRLDVSRALSADHVTVMYYDVPPGDVLSGAYHTHNDQEELFLVFEGRATFMTEDGDVTVGEGEAIRFAPGEFQHGYNDEEEALVAIALGAPPGMEDTESVFVCTGCEQRARHDVVVEDGVPVTECWACGERDAWPPERHRFIGIDPDPDTAAGVE